MKVCFTLGGIDSGLDKGIYLRLSKKRSSSSYVGLGSISLVFMKVSVILSVFQKATKDSNHASSYRFPNVTLLGGCDLSKQQVTESELLWNVTLK